MILKAPEASGCISAPALATALEARTGRTAGPSDADVVVIQVQIIRTAQGYRADVSLQGARRQLLVDGPCSDLDEMLVLVIASGLGAAVAPRRQVPAPQAPAPKVPAPQAPAPKASVAWQLEPPRSAAAPSTLTTPGDGSRAQRWRLDVDASGRMLIGVMPRPAYAVALAVFARHGALGLRFGGAWLVSQRHPVALASAFTVRVTGALAELGVCGRGAGESVLIALFCAEVSGGAVRATGDPLWQSQARWDALLMLTPRAEARLQVTPTLGVALALGAAIPVVFPRYTYTGSAAEPLEAHAPGLGLLAELALWLRISP